MSGKRREKCSTCTRDVSLRCSSAASCSIWSGASMGSGLLVLEMGMQRAVLAVIHLAGTLVHLHGQADQAALEQRRQVRLGAREHGVAGLLLHRVAAAGGHAQVHVDEGVIALA